MTVSATVSKASLSGKTAVLSGATEGVGAEITLALAGHGANICLLTHNTARAARLVDRAKELGSRAEALSCMVEDDTQPYAALETIKRHFGSDIDIVFTNMGLMPSSPDFLRRSVADLAPSDWRTYMNTTLQGVFNSTSAAFNAMREQTGGGVIINTALYGVQPRSGLALYDASRAAIRSLVETVNLEASECGQPVSAYLLDCESDIEKCREQVAELVVAICAGNPEPAPGVVKVGD